MGKLFEITKFKYYQFYTYLNFKKFQKLNNMYGGKKEKKIDQQDDETKDKFKLFMGARVMWPPDIPDD